MANSTRSRIAHYTAFALLTIALLGAPPTLFAQGQPVTLKFVNERLPDVIRSLANILGINVILNDIPERRITFTTNVPIPRQEIGGVLESILEANQLVIVERGSLSHVLPADSTPVTGQIRYGPDVGNPPPLGIVTQLVQLQSMRAAEAVAAVKQIASPTARIEAVPRSNALLITDRGSHVARYLELLRRLDEKPQGEAGLTTYVVPLKYANAQDLAASLGQLFGVTTAFTRAPSLADRSLGRNLDYFRQREEDTFRFRQNALGEAVPVMPADTSGAQQGNLIGRTTVVPDAPSNSLMIRTAPPNFPLLRETIEALDTRPAQVLFEVTVAEITLGRGQEFGIDWSVIGGSTRVSLGSPDAFDPQAETPDFITRVITLDRANVRAVLRALATTSNVRVLSTPEILAVNNREARILVGSRVPFVASTRLGDFALDRSVQYEDVGATLTVIPTINQDDYVTVQILQEVNSLTNQVIASALNAPVISTREASTRAILRDGQTVVIGGLIGDSRDHNDAGIPFLKDIPLIGFLFKRQVENRTRTEIAIFVTAYIVRSDGDADAIRERVRSRMELNDSIPFTIPRKRP